MTYSTRELYRSLIDKYDYDYHEEDDYNRDEYIAYLDRLNSVEILYEFLDVYGLDDESEVEANIGYY